MLRVNVFEITGVEWLTGSNSNSLPFCFWHSETFGVSQPKYETYCLRKISVSPQNFSQIRSAV